MKAIYHTHGTCSNAIEFEVDDNHTIQSINFVGGCPGNTVGVAQLAKGRKAEDIIALLEDVKCGTKATSCPQQLAIALKEAIRRIDAKETATS